MCVCFACRLSHLADFDHVQLLLKASQHGVIVASGTLGDGAPFLRVGVIASHQKTGHDAPWWTEWETTRDGKRSLH